MPAVLATGSINPSALSLAGHNIHYQNINGVHYLLTKLGLSWISARSKHPKQDKEAQALYKKLQTKGNRCLTSLSISFQAWQDLSISTFFCPYSGIRTLLPNPSFILKPNINFI
jgi:hypothetical protein